MHMKHKISATFLSSPNCLRTRSKIGMALLVRRDPPLLTSSITHHLAAALCPAAALYGAAFILWAEGDIPVLLPIMVRISVLGDALKTMYNAEKRGKRQVLIRPSSRVVIKFLQVMMKKGTFPSLVDEFRSQTRRIAYVQPLCH